MRGIKVTRIYTIIQKSMHFNLFFWKEREREKEEKEKRERINRGKKQGSRIRGKEGEGRKVGTWLDSC